MRLSRVLAVAAALLFAGLLFNVLVNPAKVVLQQREERDYVG